MSKFKVGDKVRCIYAYDSRLDIGVVYTVGDVSRTNNCIIRLKYPYSDYEYHVSRFELVKEEPTVKFRPGDKVRCIDSHGRCHPINQGDGVTVRHIEWGYGGYILYFSDASGGHYDFNFELVKEEPKVKFKAGDRVICINSGDTDLTVGNEYIVSSVNDYLDIIYLRDNRLAYAPCRFELVKEPRFKVGDLVTYESKEWLFGVTKGAIYCVYEISAAEDKIKIKDDVGSLEWFSAWRFDPYKVKPIAAPKPTANEFKVGDLVRFTNNALEWIKEDATPRFVAATRVVKDAGSPIQQVRIYMDRYKEHSWVASEHVKLVAATITLHSEQDNHIDPAHYTQFPIQPLTYIRANDLSFTRGNIIKYATRAGHKAGEEDVKDLEKIIRYAQAEIEAIKRLRDIKNGLSDPTTAWSKAI